MKRVLTFLGVIFFVSSILVASDVQVNKKHKEQELKESVLVLGGVQNLISKNSPNSQYVEKQKSDDSLHQELKWKYNDLGSDKQGQPSTEVSLVVNGKIYVVDTINFSPSEFSDILKENYSSLDFPANTLLACRAWVAGYGADYWIIRNGRELNVWTRTLLESDSYDPKTQILQTILLD